MRILRAFIIELAVMLAVALALAAMGPFGSFDIGSFARRLAYWLPAALCGYLFFRPTLILAALAGRKLHIAEPLALVGGVLAASVPMSFFVLWLNGRPMSRMPSFENWLQLYVQVALIGAVVTLIFWLLERQTRSTPVATTAAAAPAPGIRETPREAAFLARLPAHLRGGLIALQMEDHYVRAHAANGSTLILMRMRDAVAELDGIEGMQVHRSWWVAREAVRESVSTGRGAKLLLEGGLEAPVARSSIPALRAAGWLD
jgi:hypothetical protein